MGFLLRGYQVEALARAEAELLARRRALVMMCTGGGKTIVFAALAERWRPRGRVLVIAHREELLNQAVDKIHAATLLRAEVEQAERAVGRPLPDVVVASVQTLASERRRAAFSPTDFDLVIVDEAHHAAAASYRTVLDHFGRAAHLGVTASPDRADGLSLAPIFGNTVFRYGIRRAIRDGYLVDLRRVVETLWDLDLSRIRVRAGDFDAAELEAVLTQAPAVEAVARAIVRHAGERPTVAFCAGIAHSKAVAAAVNRLQPGTATYASGEEREGVEALTSGRVRLLCNADLTTEGFDFPPLACVALVRPTKSGGRCTQQVGRVTRLADGKRDAVVVEFRGGRTEGQVTAVDVVGSDLPPRVRHAAEALLDKQPAMSVLEALERAAALAGAVAVAPSGPRARAAVDPMKIILSLDGMHLEPPRPGALPATPEQMALLEREGLRAAGLDRRQASLLLEGVRWRRARRLASPAQALDLFRYGFELELSAERATRELARMRVAA